MPEVTIDGKRYEFDPEKDKKLLQFALENGVEIPYFCYHPAMSIPTNCRMCLVDVGFPMKDRQTGEPILDEDGNQKIGWGRKPMTSCSQDMVPDMVVRTNRTSPAIDKAQKGVLEFMLINHPLDCPICDQAGECPLQIQTYKYGPEGSRFELNKVHKPKRVQLGPRVTLDAERCINCTRCTRFTDEISGTKQLEIINRGEKNFPAAAPGKVFDDLYSMNTIDLCPVGALTSTTFRFKARAWEMNYTAGICTDCAKGCNIDVWVRDNEVLRLTPRPNPEINDFWMCDPGRLGYTKFNDMRLTAGKLKGDLPVDWSKGIYNAGDLVKEHRGNVLFIGSAFASVENNHALKEFAEANGAEKVFFVPHIKEGNGDDFLMQDDITPNRRGAELVGLEATSLEDLLAKIEQEKPDLVYLMEDDRIAPKVVEAAPNAVVVHAWHYFDGFEEADVVLGAAMEIEQPGTFIGVDEIPQVTKQARQIREMTPEDWMAMSKSRLDAGGQLTDRWRKAEHIKDVLVSWKIFNRIMNLMGESISFNDHKDYFRHLQEQYPKLKEARLPKRKAKESFKMSQFEFAIDVGRSIHKI